MTLTTRDFNPQLDLAPWIGQRSATFSFSLVNGVSGEPLGSVTPHASSPPTISHDTSRTIKRQLSMTLGVADTAAINPLTDRVDVAMIVKSVTYPLGRYMFIDPTKFKYTSGNLSTHSLYDEMFVVDQQLDVGFTARDGNVASDVIRLLVNLPITVNIEATSYPGTGSWGAGTTRGQVLNALATQGDYFTPWFANDHTLKMIRTVDPGIAIATFDWDVGNSVFYGAIAETTDVLTAPNRFVVISNSGDAADSAIVGTYDVPASAPHSIANRGFVIPDVSDLQVTTELQANAAAKNLGIRQTIFERREISTAPDPRHDSYDVIRWDGDNWLEIAWSLACVEGGTMNHTLRKAYS